MKLILTLPPFGTDESSPTISFGRCFNSLTSTRSSESRHLTVCARSCSSRRLQKAIYSIAFSRSGFGPWFSPARRCSVAGGKAGTYLKGSQRRLFTNLQRALHELVVTQEIALCNLSSIAPGSLPQNVDTLVRARIFWYSHIIEGVTTGLRGGRTVL